MKSKLSLISFILILFLAFSACNNNDSSSNTNTTAPTTEATKTVIDKDREGNSISLPDSIERIIVIGPSNTEVFMALGFGDMIIASDEYSAGIEGLSPDIPLFSMMEPDGEQIIDLNPDVIFVTGMSKVAGEDKFKVVSDAGICVVYIPSSSSIDAIKEDILFVSAVMGVQSKGQALVDDMNAQIAAIKQIGDSITDKKSVYFEIGAAPYMYSFGKGVFLNEMLELVGAVNIMADQSEWISVTDEVILDANPDVILTSVNYIDAPVDEIMSRPGWDVISAVANEQVFYIDTDSCNRPNHNITKALKMIAESVYPDLY